MMISDLETKKLEELQQLAKESEVENVSSFNKKDLIFAILKQEAEAEGLIFAQGVLEIMPDGFGFLRRVNYLPHEDDIYIDSGSIINADGATGGLKQTANEITSRGIIFQ